MCSDWRCVLLGCHRLSVFVIAITDGKAMNAQHDYMIRMAKEALPPIPPSGLLRSTTPSTASLSRTKKKYSVGQNAGMKLNTSGGIEISVVAAQPEGLPAENWMLINREDLGIDVIMRVYCPI